ncbi:Rad9-domain-containing protein [Immersiella caudata]|uniref:DNA repair protein rad9 n=1 Tax=Immersiella caudata TaxID=314043 RepID=A0AA39WXS9_9PEZI|nr:Rad9-domain-containing protein [Immersiella caudata]
MVLGFTLSEEGVAILHDALACMFKFSDDVCLEAKKDKLILTTLNISKSAYICFTFAASRFFSRYHFEGNSQYRDRFFCQLYVRSLLSVFRARQCGGESTGRESVIERCEVAIEDGPGKKSRLIARVTCRNGITASHSLAFEPKTPTHAKFDKTEATNHWAISSRTLRQLMDHFGPGIELLDINTDDDTRVVNFTCFTEKVQRRGANSNEAVLKKPLHTNIAVEMDEFDDVQVEDKLHIIISVKDFRAILQHAQMISGDLTACYSSPGRPMKLSYNSDGVLCEFILMTVGEEDAISQKHKTGRANSAVANAGRQELDSGARRASSVVNESQARNTQAKAPAKVQTKTQAQPQAQGSPRNSAAQQKTPPRPRQPGFDIRPQPNPPASARSTRSDSLFVGQVDDDQQWEPLDEEEEEEAQNDRLEWNSNNEPKPSTLRISSYANPTIQTNASEPDQPMSGLEPTQRLSQVRRFGLFSS